MRIDDANQSKQQEKPVKSKIVAMFSYATEGMPFIPMGVPDYTREGIKQAVIGSVSTGHVKRRHPSYGTGLFQSLRF